MNRPPPQTDPEALIAALAESARDGAPSGEPEPEELLDYLEGRLPPADEERVARQLAASPEAARALLDLADLEAAGAAAGTQPAELAARAGWRDLERRLPAAAAPRRRPPPWLSTLAAALLVSTVGLGGKVYKDWEERSRPVANVKSVELVSQSRAAGEETVPLHVGDPLRLVLRPAQRCPRYDAEVEGPGGRNRRTASALEPDERGNLTLLLQRTEPGSYGLRLYGCEPRHELEAHRFRVTAR
jgi:hypothetical protein